MANRMHFYTPALLAVLMAAYGIGMAEEAKDAKDIAPCAACDGRFFNRTDLNLPARLNDFRAELAAPLHDHVLRNAARKAMPRKEASLVDGYSLHIDDPAMVRHLDVTAADFKQFMAVCMEVQAGSRRIRLWPCAAIPRAALKTRRRRFT